MDPLSSACVWPQGTRAVDPVMDAGREGARPEEPAGSHRGETAEWTAAQEQDWMASPRVIRSVQQRGRPHSTPCSKRQAGGASMERLALWTPNAHGPVQLSRFGHPICQSRSTRSFTAMTMSRTAKLRLNSETGRRCANQAPIGAVIMLNTAIPAKAGRYTNPSE